LGFLQSVSEGVILRVRIQPRAANCEIAGVSGGYLKVRVTAPPVEGAANKACRDFLAKQFGIPKGRIAIVSGEKSRQKRILLKGIREDVVSSQLSAILKESP
jgi:uncharacterized protein (TIGR00251 family)